MIKARELETMPEQIQIHMIEFGRFPPGMYFKVTFTKKVIFTTKKRKFNLPKIVLYYIN